MNDFTFSDARRESVPLLIGLMGPSGGGKTYSALRLATGIQSVVGGEICGIDTEARRMLNYADRFKFKHLEFRAPFGPLRYLEAIHAAVARGCKTIIVDSMSHEHEGPGGVLEMHHDELERMGGQETKKFLAWQKPKRERRRLINEILQMNANFVFCFRAKDKIKIVNGKPVPQGFMPIAGEEFVFEMTANALLLPHADGVPTWQSNEIGERMMMKLPEQFKALFRESRPLDEETGAALATWAKGGETAASVPDAIMRGAKAAADAGMLSLSDFWETASKSTRAALKPHMDGPDGLKALAKEVDRMSALQETAKQADASSGAEPETADVI